LLLRVFVFFVALLDVFAAVLVCRAEVGAVELAVVAGASPAVPSTNTLRTQSTGGNPSRILSHDFPSSRDPKS
jgi:hypothetical protein